MINSTCSVDQRRRVDICSEATAIQIMRWHLKSLRVDFVRSVVNLLLQRARRHTPLNVPVLHVFDCWLLQKKKKMHHSHVYGGRVTKCCMLLCAPNRQRRPCRTVSALSHHSPAEEAAPCRHPQRERRPLLLQWNSSHRVRCHRFPGQICSKQAG